MLQRHDILLLATMAAYKHTYTSVTAHAMKQFHLRLYYLQLVLKCIFSNTIYGLFNRGFTKWDTVAVTLVFGKFSIRI
jgi:hypothetical protein